MSQSFDTKLSRRERQIMQVIYRTGSATAAEVLEALPDPPSYSAVRALLRVLEEKGHVAHSRDGARYVYAPTRARDDAARSALSQVVRTFFGGKVEEAVATLVTESDAKLSQEELGRLAALIDAAREEGR
jgi:predicted transcriptional regulator